MPLHNNPWLEIVSLNDNNQTAVRVWQQSVPEFGEPLGYFQCQDLSGAAFQPTGFPGESSTADAPSRVQAIITGPSERADPFNTQTYSDQNIVDLETGIAPRLQVANWNLGTDILGRSILCTHEAWTGDRYQLLASDIFELNFHPATTSDTPTGILGYDRQGDTSWSGWRIDSSNVLRIDNGFQFPVTRDVEFVENSGRTDVRFWLDSENRYYCNASELLGATGDFGLVQYRYGEAVDLLASGNDPNNSSDPETNSSESADEGSATQAPTAGPDDEAVQSVGSGAINNPAYLLLMAWLMFALRRKRITKRV